MIEDLPKTGYMALYSDIKQEVSTEGLFHALIDRGISVVYPKVNPENNSLDFYHVKSLSDFKKGAYAILEPTHFLPQVSYEKISMICVPGIVFDWTGHRIGYGKGYYDRTLRGLNALKVGLAFSFQIVDKVPHSDTDEKIDVLVSEDSVKRIGK